MLYVMRERPLDNLDRIFESYKKTKNKPFFVAKSYLKWVGQPWNLKSNLTIANKLKQYQKEDERSLSNLLEFICQTDYNDSNTTLMEAIQEANNFMLKKEEIKNKQTEQAIDFMAYLS